MGTLYLVRHGQASFGTDHYDRLSDLGWQQARQLGHYWRQCWGPHARFDQVICGDLQRQRETWQGIAEEMGLPPRNEAYEENTALNEYNVPAVLAAIHPEPLPGTKVRADYLYRLDQLYRGLTAWMAGRLQPKGLPSYPEFTRRVLAVLEPLRRNPGGRFLVVSSAGPISAVVAHFLQLQPAMNAQMNLLYRNAGITEMHLDEHGWKLMSFNALPHLEHREHQDWITSI